ncbi:DnaT-like ssDNA-binding domain-containing protein [Klebsiella pneumoniae]
MEDSLTEKEGKGREKDTNPTLYAQERNFPQQPQYLPGVDIPIGKFTMHDLWLPSQDWPRLAATWGIALPEPAYLPTELAEFIAYWKSEGKVFTQIQWEQKFARSVISARAKSKPQPATGGKGHAGIQPANTASRAVQEIQAARERWEKQNGLAGGGYGLAAMDGNGGDILEPVDPEERGGALGYVDCPDWIDE